MPHAIKAALGTVLYYTVLSVTPCFSDTAQNDLIVRYARIPKNLGFFAKVADAQVDVINEDEGVVKMKFNSPEEKERALKRLSSSVRVLNVTENALYRPAVVMKIRTTEPDPGGFGVLRQLEPDLRPRLGPFFLTGVPDVSLPPRSWLNGPDPLSERDWALKKINAFNVDAPAVAGDTRPIIAAVIDTGVDYNHEDLVAGMWRDGRDPRRVGYDFAHNTARPYDVVKFDIEGCLKNIACALGIDTSMYLVNPGHGTHCAGHVGAVVNNALGIRGVGEAVSVMGLKIFYDAGDPLAGQGDDAAAIKAVDYALKNGVKVINASWGTRMTRERAEASELKAALLRARDAGVIVVVAAGNDGVDQDVSERPAFPAAYELDNLIVVAATDKNDKLAFFSNYGARSVHIAAPGVRIFSTIVGSGYNDMIGSFRDETGRLHEVDWSGTSMAAPLVAGAVAMVWSRYPYADYREIRERILRAARQAPELIGKVATAGVLDIGLAMAN